MNRLHRVLSLVLSVVILVYVLPIRVSATDTGDYRKFLQGDERWGSQYAGGGQNIANWGCLITSLSMIMAYADPDLRDVSTFNPGIAAHGSTDKKINAYLKVSDGGCCYDSF